MHKADIQGYSIETRCRAYELPEVKEHRVLTLGKKPLYFDPEYKDFAWPNILPDIIPKIANATNENGEEQRFELVAAAGGDIDGFKQGFINLGKQTQDEWNRLVASSKAMVSFVAVLGEKES